jgi:hypothetical protein
VELPLTSRTRRLLSIAGVAALLFWAADGAEQGRARQAAQAEGALARAGASNTDRPLSPPPPVADPAAVAAAEAALAAATAAAYVPGELRLRLAEGVDLQAFVAEHDLELRRAPGPSGAALVAVRGDRALGPVMDGLRADPRVRGLGRNGRTHGATAAAVPALRAHQWHLDLMHVSDSPAAREAAAGVVVAVLDSGVAYVGANEGGQTFAQAPGLAGVSVLSPYDFVEDDALPLDEHMHGTHIATSILGQGAALGVAPGAALMPLRVLNANNQGNEHDLIDALYWAADHGADLINLSLSFSAGYAPSVELQQALERARSMGVLILGAAGNGGADAVSWPAASPHVLAVGAVRPEAQWGGLGGGAALSAAFSAAPYSNHGLAMGLMAPGGDLSRDLTGDGYVDGILAEAPKPGDPSATGTFFMAGTSQAAALATGVAARLLAQGVDPAELAALMRKAGWRQAGEDTALLGFGGGLIDLAKAEAILDQPLLLDPTMRASAMGFLRRGTGSRVSAAVAVELRDGDGEPVVGATARVRVWDGFLRAETLSCTSDAAGRCTVEGLAGADKLFNVPLPVGFSYEVVRVEGPAGDMVRPLSFFYANDGLELIERAAQASAAVPAGHQLAVRWGAGSAAGHGNMAPSTLFPSLGTGLSTSPIGLFSPQLSPLSFGTGLSTSPIGVVLNPTALTLLVSGSGLSTSPIGRSGVQSLAMSSVQLSLDGTGLSTSPIGLMSTDLIRFSTAVVSSTFLAIDGSGLSTSPIGFSGGQLFTAGGGVNLAGASLEGGVPVLSMSDATGALSGTALGARVAEGGFVGAGFDLVTASVYGGAAAGASTGAATPGAPIAFE